MTIAIKHQFVSLKGDGGDATQVQPSYWNAAHAFTLASGQLVGRLSAGAGAAEEIPISAYMASILGTPDAATLGSLLGSFETGDYKYTLRAAASSGWIFMVGGVGVVNTVGNGSSGATSFAGAGALALFTLVYNSCSDAVVPVSGGRSGNPTNDFNANKTIQIPNPVGRMPIGAGNNTASTSSRFLGALAGAETHTLGTANLPAYTPAGSVSTTISPTSPIFQQSAGNSVTPPGTIQFIATNGTGMGLPASSTFSGFAQGGSSTAITQMNPFIGLNVMVKL